MKKHFLKNNRGLTLVELIIGVTIMAIIVAPLLHSFVTSAGTANKSRRAAAATTAAQNLAEQIEAMPAEKFFANAGVLGAGAQFYKLEGAGESLTYKPIGTKPPEDDKEKKHYIGIPNYNGKYDALITLNSEKPINNTKISIGNPMDAVIDMTGAEINALAAYKTAASGLDTSNKMTLEELKRKMQITVTKDENKNQYNVNAEFTYTANIHYKVTTKDADGKPVVKEEVKVFQYTDIGTTSVAKSAEIKDGVPLGVYLFFNDISANVVRNETLTATVGAGAEEFNLFVVNAAAEYETVKSREKVKPLPNYSLEVYYRYQKDNKIYRVFSNLAPEDIRYLAYNSASQIKYTRMDMSGSLVEKKVKNLLYGINISLFEQNSNFKGNPIVSFDTEKLA